MKLSVEGLTLAHGARIAIRDVALEIEPGHLVGIIGPNGSGKSTLLRGMARLHRPLAGHVYLDGHDLNAMPSRTVARHLAILPQSPASGLDLTVGELVWRGRFPHQGLLQRPRPHDAEAVRWAIHAANIEELAGRPLGSLSGGERQRAWIAMALAQEPRILLLDEPTSFLDLRHQLEVMHLLRKLVHDGMTVVAVLHDLALVSRFCERVIAIRDGQVAFDGDPREVLEPVALERVFDVPIIIVADPVTGAPVPLPAPDASMCPQPAPLSSQAG